jgi:hypothetical protein
MKNLILSLLVLICCNTVFAQIGVGTASPNSTLDVRGSMALIYKSFTANTNAAIGDNLLVFTGTSAASLTLPDASTCTGRTYWVKNSSSNSSVLTIATTSSQTIDGLGSWTLTQQYKAARLVSNGANWIVLSESLPGNSSGTAWINGGNGVGSTQNIGTTSNFDLPFITNNTEKMRLTAAGSLGVGTSTFNATYPERFLADAGATGNTNYQNVIVGKGNTNSYAQLNIQNSNAGTGASSDVVATADNGNESSNYVDMGINSSANTSGIMGGADDAYLYNIGQNFLLGTGTAAKSLVFMTGGTTQSTNERMRIDGTGKVGIGTNAPSSNLHVVNSGSVTNNIAQFFTPALPAAGSTYLKLGKALSSGDAANINFVWAGSDNASNYLGFGFHGKSTGMALTNAGNLGVGTTTFDATNPEKFLVDAGTTSSVNAISGKGTINSYLQLNIQNKSTGTAASSDVVATADNGNETTNFVDMGINSSGYSATGILGGANNAYLYSSGNDFVIGNSTNNKSLIFFTTVSGTNTERMRINNTGLIPGQDNTYSSGNSTNRWTAVWAANGTIQTSDIRLKKNIQPLAYGLKEVLKLQPVRYDWKDNSGRNKIGLIAQEVKKIIPEVVIGDESKENLGMNYAEMVPVLINAIKDLNKKVDTLEITFNKLKK